MNKAQSHRISYHSQPVGLARVCLALATPVSQTVRQRRTWGKTIGATLHRHPLVVLSSAKCHPRTDRAMLQSP
jgi:hypothetical protein